MTPPARGRDPASPSWLPYLVAGALWLALALAAGASGLVRALRPPAPQALLVLLTLVLIAAGALLPGLRALVLDVDVRVPVALHVTRVVGAYFLLLFQRAELPFAFAVPGGWGDVLVAGLALALVLAGPPTTTSRWRAYLLWNVLALLDLLYVVVTAARLALAEPASMAPLQRLPLSLLPTFLVPLLLATHVLVFVRLFRRRPR